jgi:hypothetical protein
MTSWKNIASVTALAVTATVPMTAYAHAARGPGDVTCRAGRLAANFEPALGLMTADTRTSTSGTLSDCVSTSNPDVTSARYTGTINGVAGCLEGFKAGDGTFRITWNNSKTSVIDISFSGQSLGGFQAEGNIRDGLFKGASFSLNGQVINQIGSIGPCIAGNLSSQTGAIRQAVIG